VVVQTRRGLRSAQIAETLLANEIAETVLANVLMRGNRRRGMLSGPLDKASPADVRLKGGATSSLKLCSFFGFFGMLLKLDMLVKGYL